MAYAYGYGSGGFGQLYPAIYKIDGDLTTGEVGGFEVLSENFDYSTAGNQMQASSLLSIITNDADWGVWPNSFNGVGLVGVTVSAGLSGLDISTEVLDTSDVGVLVLSTQTQTGNSAPVLTNPTFANGVLSITYSDADNNLSTSSDVFIEDMGFTMIPDGHTYSDGVVFSADVGNMPGLATFQFSDGADTVQLEFDFGGSSGGCQLAGDVNEDGAINVLDIVNIVNHILATVVLEDTCAADFNEDGDVNVLDIVNIVNVILGGKTAADATEATLIQSGGSLLLKSDGYIGGIEMTLIHGEDFSLELSGNSLVSDYVTRDGQTKVVVVVPEGEVLFTATGDYTVEDVLVANSHSAVSVNQASKFELSSAYPNPFNPVTSMSFTMPQDGLASVKVYNLMGQQVALLADGNYTQGMHQLTWNASDLSSGVYIVKAIYAGNVSVQKVMLVK